MQRLNAGWHMPDEISGRIATMSMTVDAEHVLPTKDDCRLCWARPWTLFLRALTPAICLVTLVSFTSAATRVVEPGPTTIHEAMALSAPGDSVVLKPGRYLLSQGVIVRQGVILTSTDGPLATILDMQFKTR